MRSKQANSCSNKHYWSSPLSCLSLIYSFFDTELSWDDPYCNLHYSSCGPGYSSFTCSICFRSALYSEYTSEHEFWLHIKPCFLHVFFFCSIVWAVHHLASNPGGKLPSVLWDQSILNYMCAIKLTIQCESILGLYISAHTFVLVSILFVIHDDQNESYGSWPLCMY